MPYPPITPKRLEGAQPLCPLYGMPPIERAWSARRGDVILLRTTSRNPDAFFAMHEVLRMATAQTGVEFLLLGPDVEVVPPGGDDA